MTAMEQPEEHSSEQVSSKKRSRADIAPDDENEKSSTATRSSRADETDSDDEGDDISPMELLRRQQKIAAEQLSNRCPFLDSIDRNALDFDQDPRCEVTMSELNVYVCLVCGCYLAGRHSGSPAHTHALADNHRVFVQLSTRRFYCLPDDYEITDTSLVDIAQLIRPKISAHDLREMDRLGPAKKGAPPEDEDDQLAWEASRVFRRAHDGQPYVPGIIAVDNVGNVTDWFGAVLLAMLRVRPLRDFFAVIDLDDSSSKNSFFKRNPSNFVRRFAEFVRRQCFSRQLRAHVSPHATLLAAQRRSEGLFNAGERADVGDFMAWFLHAMHEDLRQAVTVISTESEKKRRKSSGGGATIVSRCFRGGVKIHEKIPVLPAEKTTDELLEMTKEERLQYQEHYEEQRRNPTEFRTTTKRSPFFLLKLALPPAPLFRDVSEERLIPTIPLSDVLAKFDGTTVVTDHSKRSRRFRLTRLPKFMVLHFERFVENHFFVEKNPTIIRFPLSGLDMAPYLEPLSELSVKELKQLAKSHKIVPTGERADIEKQIESKRSTSFLRRTYLCMSAHACWSE
ncbi:MAG: hypothetical protein MHM6MM_002235 [Cercozoa sp. M6MM]